MVTYSITLNVINLQVIGETSIQEDSSVTLQLIPISDLRLPTRIIVSGAQYSYADETGYIYLSHPTQDITITAAAITSKQRYKADMDELVDIINQKASSSGKKNLGELKATAKLIDPAPPLQEKQVTPAVDSDISVRPDINYYGLREVLVSKIPYDESDNEMGGKTATIG